MRACLPCGAVALALALALVATLAASAAPPCVTVGPAQGVLEFSATQAGAQFDGRFAKFEARLCFDPRDLAASRFEVSVEPGSAVTGDAERDTALDEEAFFAIARFPQARYTAARFTASGAGRFAAAGELTLRGVTKPVALAFRWSPTAGGGARLEGEAQLRRLAFGVGQGEWSDTEWIADEVQVRFRLALPRPPPSSPP